MPACGHAEASKPASENPCGTASGRLKSWKRQVSPLRDRIRELTGTSAPPRGRRARCNSVALPAAGEVWRRQPMLWQQGTIPEVPTIVSMAPTAYVEAPGRKSTCTQAVMIQRLLGVGERPQRRMGCPFVYTDHGRILPIDRSGRHRGSLTTGSVRLRGLSRAGKLRREGREHQESRFCHRMRTHAMSRLQAQQPAAALLMVHGASMAANLMLCMSTNAVLSIKHSLVSR